MVLQSRPFAGRQREAPPVATVPQCQWPLQHRRRQTTAHRLHRREISPTPDLRRIRVVQHHKHTYHHRDCSFLPHIAQALESAILPVCIPFVQRALLASGRKYVHSFGIQGVLCGSSSVWQPRGSDRRSRAGVLYIAFCSPVAARFAIAPEPVVILNMSTRLLCTISPVQQTSHGQLVSRPLSELAAFCADAAARSQPSPNRTHSLLIAHQHTPLHLQAIVYCALKYRTQPGLPAV